MAWGSLSMAETEIAQAIDWLGGAFDWLGNLLDPVGEILTWIWPPVLAGIAAIALLRTVRWLLLLWRGRTPRVQISTFAWATSEDANREATWVTSLFREQLAALRLDALDPLPERAPGAPLVEIVEGVGQGVSRDLGGAAARLFRAAWPDSAYEVWGTLRPHDRGRGGRVSVQLIERRRGNRTLLNIALEEASWEDGARQAALAVAGALYPEVRERDRGPWTAWKRTVPLELMDHYHAARRHEEANRLEQALAEYHAALDQDPLNPNLRLKIAMLQERLALYIDAWVTYEAIVDESDRRAWRGPNRRVYLLALYRLAVMLSNGRVAAQWVKRASVGKKEGTLRDLERHERRAELVRSLEGSSLLAPNLTKKITRRGLPGAFTNNASFLIAHPRANLLLLLLRTVRQSNEDDILAVFREGDESEGRERFIEAALRILSLRRLEELETALRIASHSPREWRERRIHGPGFRQRLQQPELPRSAVRISKLLVTIRIAASLEYEVTHPEEAARKLENGAEWIGEIREGHRALTERWPFPTATGWRRPIHRLGPRRRWSNRRDDAWQLYYNAACLAASVLRKGSVLHNAEREDGWQPLRRRRGPWRRMKLDHLEALSSGTTESDIVDRAIELLEEYAFRAGSDRVAAQADWLAIDDSDFRELRKEPEFKRWASHHLPGALPQDSSRKADVKRFTIRIAREGARAFAAAWRERAFREEDPTAAEVAEWWRIEAGLWSELGDVWREHLSWQQRLSWLQTLQAWLRENGASNEIKFGHEARGAAADSMHPELFARLAELAVGNGSEELTSPIPNALAWAHARAQHVRVAHEAGERRADASGALLAEAERQEALKACRIWTRLAELLDLELAREARENESDEERRAQDEELQKALASIGAELSSTP